MQSEFDEAIEEDTQKGKYLTFSLGNEAYAVEIEFVKEIVNIMPITKLPELPSYVKGIISLRESIIPVIDLRIRLHMQEIPYTSRTCVIILNVFESQIGFIVDEVKEVIDIAEENVVPPPSFKTSGENRFLKAIGKTTGSVKLILDSEKLITEDECASIMGVVS